MITNIVITLRCLFILVSLTYEEIYIAAQTMEELFVEKGYIVINQDETGDSFYIVEEGMVLVTRKVDSTDANEVPREIVRLGKDSHFGEVSLLTSELRSATVTVISEKAKLLRMMKSKFDELIAATHKVRSASSRMIGKDVLEMVPLFKNLSAMNKKKLLEVMNPVTFPPMSYICRQGTKGNTFFIITEGTCKVTVNADDQKEREVIVLKPGDLFGNKYNYK